MTAQNNTATAMPDAHITYEDNGQVTELTVAMDAAFKNALIRRGKIPPPVQSMPGMSGQKYRYFINNLIEALPDARYLETGSWAGSTMCSAVFGNACVATAIDNWSEFEGPTGHFLRNMSAVVTKDIKFSMLTQDFRAVRYDAIGKFNVYLFDGPHEAKDQYDGLALAMPALDDEFVFIVDDWNWERVRQGTFAAIAAVGLEIVKKIEVRTTLNNANPSVWMEKSDWHNGYFISVLRKPKK